MLWRKWNALKGETTFVVFATSDDGVILLARNEVQAEDGKRHSGKDDTECTIIDTQRKSSTVAVETVVNLKRKGKTSSC